jgi:metal-responsive CopG/Arc/MetJ family transcriptional regulator
VVQLIKNSPERKPMPRFSISVDDDLNEFVENLADEEYSSKSKAAAALLTVARELHESEYNDLDELLATANRVDELEAELEHQEARADDLRRQLQAANAKDERVQELAQYVEKEQRVEQQWREAGLLTKTKWRLLGMPSEDQSA